MSERADSAIIRASVFIATSLDGFISRPDGSIDWLLEANKLAPEGEDCGYGAFSASVDVLVMGRSTFEQVVTFDPWPYADKRVVVLSRGPVAIPDRLAPTVSCSSEAPRALLERLALEGHRHAYIDGGVTIQRFLAEGLVDELTITVIPVLIGRGRPLFGPLPADLELSLVRCKSHDFGFVQMVYRPRARS